MLHKEEENRVVKVIVKKWITCDICHEEIKEGAFDIHEGEIRLKTGSSYPECGSSTEVRADICSECFNKLLVPWLESKGVTMAIIESEW